MGDLRGRLGRIYSPVRAEMIAVTEVTRAAAEGERATVREIEKEGIRMVEVWQTNNDSLVCPICGPRHGKKVGDGWSKNDGPPAHPRCRCWLTHTFTE
jgi:SPP1 gp7 family putative phage head morphogenesis protein